MGTDEGLGGAGNRRGSVCWIHLFHAPACPPLPLIASCYPGWCERHFLMRVSAAVCEVFGAFFQLTLTNWHEVRLPSVAGQAMGQVGPSLHRRRSGSAMKTSQQIVSETPRGQPLRSVYLLVSRENALRPQSLWPIDPIREMTSEPGISHQRCNTRIIIPQKCLGAFIWSGHLY